MKEDKFKLDFVVVGSQRCGTTWIDRALRSTGKILLPENKQTYYYDRNYSLGLEWYKQQFNLDDKVKYELIGEVATGYCLEGAINLLAKDFPETKVILAVREPVSRAYSNYIKRSESYSGLSFEEALLSDKDLVDRGLYGDMLSRIYKYFPEENIKIVFFDDLNHNPKKFISEVINFLGIDCRVDETLLTQNVNSSLLTGISKWTKKYKLYFLITLVKKIGLTSYVRKFIYKLHKMKRSSSVTHSPKLHQIFQDSNKILEEKSHKELDAWRV